MMKKICLVLAFVSVAFAAVADPKDYPPTAFQLAQIHHYVTHEAEFKDNISKLWVLKRADEVRHALSQSEAHDLKRYLEEAEDFIKSFVPNPLEATKDDWKQYVESVTSRLTTSGVDDLLSACFLENETKPVILSVIQAEQEALKNGEVILWRASANHAELDSELSAEVGARVSFSHGLFSGFLFDGHDQQNSGFSSSLSACTYVYFSAFLKQARIANLGGEGFYAKLRENFPECFADQDLPKTLPVDFHPSDFLLSMCDYYDSKKTAEGKNKSQEIMGKYFHDYLYIWDLFGGKRPVPHCYLYGLTLSQDELESARENAKINGCSNACQNEYVWGEFFQAEHAVYGRGETFHPKLHFPQKSRIIKLFDHRGIKAAAVD